MRAKARACANIALAKYWGKSDVALNLPAVPSISMTLDRMSSETTVEFVDGLASDEIAIGGEQASAGEARRAVELLDRVRAAAGIAARARVVSTNDFPTAAGLASSASGFAALAAAACAAAKLDWDDARLSALARRSSASAGRSIHGGFVELAAGAPGDDALAATLLAPAEHWDVRMVVAIVSTGRKDVGSTDGMELSRTTSPYYRAWVDAAPALCEEVRAAILARDLARLGPAMEQSTMAMHACAIAARPGILYWLPVTLEVLATVRRVREKQGLGVWATMDAGPHVKVVCLPDDVDAVRRALSRTEGVLRTVVCAPGPRVRIEPVP